MEAKKRGAKVIHVDPRFTRTSAMADLHIPIRVGTDIAFLGGLVRYVIENDRYFKEYVTSYTNAAVLVSDDFVDTEDLDGLFSGWDSDSGSYKKESWAYANGEPRPDAPRDDTLQDPRCVFQIVRRHFSRYTPEMIEEICGIPQDLFLAAAEMLSSNSGRDRTAAFCYAVGWTQHTVGVQYIRTASILQLLLGNIGRPGGGILALRGHASIQGSTDVPTLYNILPGYLPMPKADQDVDLESYIDANKAEAGWWTEFPKYIVSMLKAWFGDAATPENGFCFDHLPRLTGDHSHQTTVADMADGSVSGYFVMGENPVVGSMHGSLQRKGLRELDWLVVRDFAPTETAEFWRASPEITGSEIRPEDIKTEVFFFPCAAHTEKDGTFTNTQRLLQWHEAAIEPPGDCRSELHFMYHLGLRMKDLYRSSRRKRDRPIKDLTWDYPTKGPHGEPDANAVLGEINGWSVDDRTPLSSFTELKDDGSTAAGVWIYTGSFAGGVNQTARRRPGDEQTWVAPEWGWAWPANRRILYNRASADPEGRPWSDRKRYVWWDETEKRWTGEDVPDFIADRPPDYEPAADAEGLATIGGRDAFIMQVDGRGWLFAPTGLLDGPLPTHYEPHESVVPNALYGQQCNPARMEWRRRDNPYHRAFDDPRYPYVLTTYRVTEHHTAGPMSRWLSWLSELMPEMFCEVSPELAAEKGLRNGEWATVTTARAQIESRVLVTERMPSLKIRGRTVHQIGLPYHWGTVGLIKGDSANDLISFVADPNVSIQESKALTGNIEPGRNKSRYKGLAPDEPILDVDHPARDLPVVGHRTGGSHGLVGGEGHEGDKS
jgi:formate dehydrogenase major subunit